ncbi:FDLD family class I lanthipeptide [Tumebacillus flagellatus]
MEAMFDLDVQVAQSPTEAVEVELISGFRCPPDTSLC